MNALAQQQQALLGALLALPGSAQAAEALTGLKAQVLAPWTRGLAAYQANGHDLAERLPRGRGTGRRRNLHYDGMRALAPPSAGSR